MNHAIGYTLHCLVLVPYYGWRYSHNMHRTFSRLSFLRYSLFLLTSTLRLDKATNSIERDENFCPHTRSDFSLPPAPEASQSHYAEALDEAPIVSLIRLFFQQFLGLQAYLAVNALGNRMYPKGTNVSSSFELLEKEGGGDG